MRSGLRRLGDFQFQLRIQRGRFDALLRLQIFQLKAQVDAVEVLVDVEQEKQPRSRRPAPRCDKDFACFTGSTWRTSRELSIRFTV